MYYDIAACVTINKTVYPLGDSVFMKYNKIKTI